MFYKPLIRKFKASKKNAYINSLTATGQKFAFLGVGEHSINNLYPCLQHIGVSLKYIYSATIANAAWMSTRFPESIATDSISEILGDKEVVGVFICLPPAEQYKYAVEALKANKHVFVEKPPCADQAELNNLINVTGSQICFPALQRRFSSINTLIEKHKLLDSVKTYRYSFRCGRYPEGDSASELFIHPADNVLRLFGEIRHSEIKTIGSGGAITHLLQLEHSSGVCGQLELSSNGSWNDVSELLEADGEKLSITARYPGSLEATTKSALFNLPAEKIFKHPLTKKIYLDTTGFVPSLEQNNLVVQGFFTEVSSFLDSCKTGKWEKRNDITSLVKVYEVIELLRKGN